jgi:hypothetical protein
VCDPALRGDATSCDGGDWSLVAADPDGSPTTRFTSAANATIGLLAATPTALYVGFNNASGVAVFRSVVAAPSTRTDFEGENGCSAAEHPVTCQGIGGAGFGLPTNTVIFDAAALTFDSADDGVYLTTGDGVGPVRVYRLYP